MGFEVGETRRMSWMENSSKQVDCCLIGPRDDIGLTFHGPDRMGPLAFSFLPTRLGPLEGVRLTLPETCRPRDRTSQLQPMRLSQPTNPYYLETVSCLYITLALIWFNLIHMIYAVILFIDLLMVLLLTSRGGGWEWHRLYQLIRCKLKMVLVDQCLNLFFPPPHRIIDLKSLALFDLWTFLHFYMHISNSNKLGCSSARENGTLSLFAFSDDKSTVQPEREPDGWWNIYLAVEVEPPSCRATDVRCLSMIHQIFECLIWDGCNKVYYTISFLPWAQLHYLLSLSRLPLPPPPPQKVTNWSVKEMENMLMLACTFKFQQLQRPRGPKMKGERRVIRWLQSHGSESAIDWAQLRFHVASFC